MIAPTSIVSLTNAPRSYALRVLKTLRLAGCFDGMVCIEDMTMFGQHRPKPDARMLRYPDVSATHIAFVYADDIWLVPREGGTASPLASPAVNRPAA